MNKDRLMILDLTGQLYPIAANTVSFKASTFPGGELFFRITSDFVDRGDNPKTIRIVSRLNSSDDIMRVLMATDAVKQLGVSNIELFIPYLAYSRQDRVCNKGEAASLKVFANILNQQGYSVVCTLDPHSIVAENLIDNLTIIDSSYLLRSVLHKQYVNTSKVSQSVILSPDAGALKKTYSLAQKFGFGQISVAEKVRNLSNGEIVRTKLDTEDYEGRDVWVVDDICDGGRTFIEIAKVLKDRNVGKLFLVVSHGIFSQGCEVLFEHFDEVFTTDSIVSEGPICIQEAWATIININDFTYE